MRAAHIRIATALFAGLGGQVGLWVVLIPELVAARGLSAGELGVALGVMAATSILSLIAAGRVIDRVGRRPLACAGAAGMGAAIVLLGLVEASWALLPTVAVYGLANGMLDLGANTIGADVEREHGERVMIRLHAGFSGAAAALALITSVALTAGAGHRALYVAGGAALVALALVVARAPLPSHVRVEHEDAPPGALLHLPGVVTALLLVTVCFLGDGAIEGYVPLYLRDLLGAGALLTGIGVAAFHSASLVGRLTAARAQARLGERGLITASGAGACVGMLLVVLAEAPSLAAVGLLVVGMSLAPVVPTALSVAGRADPRRAGAAVSLVTTVGYSAFVVGPPAVGALADATSLRTALVPVVATTAALALIARRL